MSINTLTPAQLRKAADLKERIAKLETELNQILGSTSPAPTKPAKRNGMSEAGKARIAAAQKKRWAKVKATKPALKATVKPIAKTAVTKPAKKKFVMSAAAKAILSAKAKARWAKIKAAKQ